MMDIVSPGSRTAWQASYRRAVWYRVVHREELIARVREILSRAGFYVSKPLNMRSISFDIVARRDKTLIIAKILSNVDAFSKENANEMKTLAEALQASPLMIGNGQLGGGGGIVYSLPASR
jgi:putative transcriptional regulator